MAHPDYKTRIYFIMSKACLIIALICFVFAVFNFNPSHFNMIALGLMFGTAAKLV